MVQKPCVLCQVPIDEGIGICPHCGEMQTCRSPGPQVPWALIGTAAILFTALLVGGLGWASAGRVKAEYNKSQLNPGEPKDSVMTADEAKRLTSRIRRRLVDNLSQWDSMADFGNARVKTNGVLQVTARVKDDDPGRRIAKVVYSHVASSVGGRFKVRGILITASDGTTMVYFDNKAPMPRE